MNNNDFLDSVLDNTKPAPTPKQGRDAKTENNLTRDALLEQSERNEILRADDWQAWFFTHLKPMFTVACVIFAVILIILVLHWVLPTDCSKFYVCTWLTDAQLDNLKNIVLAVFASSAIGSWANKIK